MILQLPTVEVLLFFWAHCICLWPGKFAEYIDIIKSNQVYFS